MAAILNDRGDEDHTPIKITFGGQSVVATDVLAKYTWNGDANIDGIVNADDYFLIDSGYITQKGGYYNGDLNLDGVVNADDYFMIDSAFIGQTGPLASGEPSRVDAPSTAAISDPDILMATQPVKKQNPDSLLATLFSTQPVL